MDVLRLHAAQEGWLAFSGSLGRVGILRPDGRGGSTNETRLSSGRNTWFGRSRLHGGMLWLYELGSAGSFRLTGLDYEPPDVGLWPVAGSFRATTAANRVAMERDRIAVGLGADLILLDVSDPRLPKTLGQLDMPGAMDALDVSEAVAWTAWRSPERTALSAVDLRLPAFLAPIGETTVLARGSTPILDLQAGGDQVWVLVQGALQVYLKPQTDTDVPGPGSTPAATSTGAPTTTSTATADATARSSPTSDTGATAIPTGSATPAAPAVRRYLPALRVRDS
jgi:hypothetical protein